MPKAPQFSARKPRGGPYSTNPETTRIREHTQSKFGLAAEIQRIKTKYRTRQSRQLQKLHNSFEWSSSMNMKQTQLEENVKRKIHDACNDEIQETTKAYEEFMTKSSASDTSSDEESSTDNNDKPTETSDINRLNEIMSDNEWITEEEDEEYEIDDEENEPDVSDPEFEDGDMDVSDNEILVDSKGNEISSDVLSSSLLDIIRSYRKPYFDNLKMFKRLSKIDVQRRYKENSQ